jgi:predicted Zn-dependent protease with MMP-like domain
MTEEEEERLETAWEALEAGAFDDALRLAKQVAAANPDDEEAADLLARASAGAGALEAALAQLTGWEERTEDPWPFFTRADLLLRAKAPQAEAALKTLKAAGRRVKRDARAEAELLWLEGVARLTLEDDGRALECFDKALAKEPEHVDARLDRGLLRFELGKFPSAREDLAPLASAPFEIPDAIHTLGLLAERGGDAAAAKQHFARATALSPEQFPAPTTLSEREFDDAVQDAIARLPDFARAQMDNVLVTVAPIPSDEDLDGGALSPTMLGIFKGTPHGARSIHSQADHATAHVVLFQKNLERATRSREELLEQIGITVAHEVGHLLGLDEEDLEERGLD